MTPTDYKTLRTELDTDPLGLGYAGKTDQQVATLLNTARQSIDLETGVLTAYQIVNCIDRGEYALLSAVDRSLLALLVSAGQVDTKSPTIRATFLAMFPSATAPVTRAALVAIQSRKGSRAEQLIGSLVTSADIAYGRVA